MADKDVCDGAGIVSIADDDLIRIYKNGRRGWTYATSVCRVVNEERMRRLSYKAIRSTIDAHRKGREQFDKIVAEAVLRGLK